MKRRVLCACALVVWVLVACTVLSVKIEDLMTPRVRFRSVEGGTLPVDALFWDEEGMHLYWASEGTGWESGTRVREEAADRYAVETAYDGEIPIQKLKVEGFGFGAGYIQYATKAPQTGEKVLGVDAVARADDRWVLVDTDPDGELLLPQTWPPAVTLVEETGRAALVEAAQQPTPFMPGQAYAAVYDGDRALRSTLPDLQVQVFSLGDVTAFADQLPLVAGIGALAVFVGILWAYSWVLVRRPRQNRTLLAVNGGLALLLLVGVYFLVQGVALPGSLLPAEVILSPEAYRGEFAALTGALAQFTGNGAAQAQAVLSRLDARGTQAGLLLGSGAVLGLAAVAVEVFLTFRKNRMGHKGPSAGKRPQPHTGPGTGGGRA